MSATFSSLALLLVTMAQLPAEPSAEGDPKDRLRFMKSKAAEFALYREMAKEPLPLKDEPVLRFSNPERDSGTLDGATFLWLERAKPVAAISFGIRRPKNAVFREHTSFSSTPLVCRKAGVDIWSPQTGGFLNRPLTDAPPPADSPAGRLTQMRTFARRFSATCYYKEDATQLRVLPQPLYRFDDKQENILDGALFAMVVSNDPEMFLLLEAAADNASDKPQWRYSLARMSSLRHTVRLDGTEVWSIPGYYTIPAAERKSGPYVEAFQGTYAPSSESPPAK
jgi:hypothetical protein